MGTYDTFISRDGKLAIQLKVGHSRCRGFIVGSVVDPSEFPDAAYHSPEGVVVIDGGVVRSVTQKMPDSVPPGALHMTKWGDAFNPKTESLDSYHPMKNLLDQYHEHWT